MMASMDPHIALPPRLTRATDTNMETLYYPGTAGGSLNVGAAVSGTRYPLLQQRSASLVCKDSPSAGTKTP